MSTNDPLNNLVNASTDPLQVTVDGQTTMGQNLADKLAVAKFLSATRARTVSPLAGVTLTKLRPHGSVFPDWGCGGRRGQI